MQNQSSSKNGATLYFRLLKYLRPYRKAFACACLGMMGSAACEPVFPAIMKYLLDKGFKTADQRLVWAIPVGIVLLFVVRAVLSFCTNYLMTWISTHVITDLQRQMFSKMLTLPTQVFHELSAGKLISRIISDPSNLAGSVTSILVTAVRESLTALALFAYLIYLDWRLTLLSLLVAPLVAWIVRGFGQRMRIASRSTVESGRYLFHCIEESAAANKVIKIYGAQQLQVDRFHRDTERFRRAQMREAIPASALTPITQIAASLAVAAVIFLALTQATSSAGVSAGGFVSFITALLLLISPIKQLTTISPTLQRGLASTESVFYFLDLPVEEDSGHEIMPRARGEITFDNVGFQYPGTDKQALEAVSFHAPAGTTIALVGSSGGGKTTISSLIPRFYRPTTGQIRIDGVDINAFSLSSLRDNIALVSQDIVLFNDTVEVNIAFGARGQCTQDEVIAAAKAAYAWEFIEKLPEGLNTFIGEDGAKLSGGQRQRIAIARALLKDAPILVLDEATSALDTESERQVQAALTTLMENRTTLVIAHRLSTIEHADQILVLNEGHIVESGTHTELLAHAGVFANLKRMQN